jgi:hypothetical protein
VHHTRWTGRQAGGQTDGNEGRKLGKRMCCQACRQVSGQTDRVGRQPDKMHTDRQTFLCTDNSMHFILVEQSSAQQWLGNRSGGARL